ncbi:MAG: hypothetical protein WCF33_10465 [Pseudonocardiaceae bacterium]
MAAERQHLAARRMAVSMTQEQPRTTIPADDLTTVAVGQLDDKELDNRLENYGLRKSNAW